MRLYVTVGGERRSIEAQEGDTLLAALRRCGIEQGEAPCGGQGKCGKCRVLCDGEEVLACSAAAREGCEVTLPERGAVRALASAPERIAPEGSGLGLAVDVGTTTVAAALYDRGEGRLLGRVSGRSAQRFYGADVISRIQAWENGESEGLTAAVRRQMGEMLDSLCAASGREREDVTLLSVAGNTVMEHILDGLSPVGIGRAPFTPLSLFGDVRAASAWLPDLFCAARAYLAPAVSGYVGGDITAGLCAAGGDRAEGLWLYMDVGTNGEMALGNADGWLCCATAAGPAFEGAEISCGMDGSPGAVDKVWAEHGEVRADVIGEGEAKGLCGSGLIDAVAALLETGELSEAGRLEEPRRMLSGEVYLSREDVRQVQLAKAAVRAGAETLLELTGHKAEDVTDLVIAGGFGAYMDANSALAIGLLPEVPRERIRHVGNAALSGAAMALTEEGRRRIDALREKCTYFELSGSAVFRELYIDCMAFE